MEGQSSTAGPRFSVQNRPFLWRTVLSKCLSLGPSAASSKAPANFWSREVYMPSPSFHGSRNITFNWEGVKKFKFTRHPGQGRVAAASRDPERVQCVDFFLDSGSRLLRKLVRNDIRENQVNFFTPSEVLRRYGRFYISFTIRIHLITDECAMV